jgi:ABC-type xylose transport system substrate-binding protein
MSQAWHLGSRRFPRPAGAVSQIGYTSVSVAGQDAQLQPVAVLAAGVQKRDVFADVTSSSKTAIERPTGHVG